MSAPRVDAPEPFPGGLCSCLKCHALAVVLPFSGRLRELTDGELPPVRRALGSRRVRNQGVALADGGHHLCLFRLPDPGKGGVA